jgi:hypothetical protein
MFTNGINIHLNKKRILIAPLIFTEYVLFDNRV